MNDSFNILEETFFENINILYNTGNWLSFFQSNPKNISRYQNSSNYSSPNSINSPESSDKSFNLIELSNKQNSYDSNNEQQQQKTPKMILNLNQNNETSIIINNSDNKSNNELQSSINYNITETKNTSNKINSQNEIIQIPIIQNIVSTIDLGCKINLKEVALQAQNSYYAPNKFSGLIMRIKEPKTTALIFSIGKMVCLGAKNEEQSKAACKKFGKILKNLNYPITLKKFKIRNIVSSCEVKFKIPLLKLYFHILKYLDKKRVTFESEFFPGLIYHCDDNYKKSEDNIQKSNMVFLVFASGKMIITGAKKTAQIYEAFDEFFPVLRLFKDDLQKKQNTYKGKQGK